MKFAAALSTHTDAESAVHEAIAKLRSAVADEDAFDFAVVNFSPHHGGDADSVAQTLIDQLALGALIGCASDGVISGGQEIEKGPALTVLAGRLPGVRIKAVHTGDEAWASLTDDADAFTEHFGLGTETRGVVAICDPWTTPITSLLGAFDTFAPGLPLIGGMASAAQQAGENVMLLNESRVDDGAVTLSFSGPVKIETVVSQGCRPVGRPYVITKCHDNIVEQLGGKPALIALEEMVNSLSESDRELLGYGLMLGRAISEYRDQFGRGDFLVRSIVGIHEQTQAIGVGDRVRVGQTVQFHVRDALSAHEDLQSRISGRQTATPAGVLCFSCNGRGTNLFPQPHHDATLLQRLMPGVAVSGFFASGELGPVGGHNFVHGHTASLALFSTP